MKKFSLKSAFAAISASAKDAVPAEGVIVAPDPLARVSANELAVREQLAFLEFQPDSELIRNRRNTALNRLGELLAQQGDYATAITVTSNPDRRAEYLSIQKAIKTPNEQKCKCQPVRMVDTVKNVEVSIPPTTNVATVRDANGNPLTLEKCHQCGFLNAR